MLPVCSLSLILVLSLTANWSWVSLYVPGYNEQLDLDTNRPNYLMYAACRSGGGFPGHSC